MSTLTVDTLDTAAKDFRTRHGYEPSVRDLIDQLREDESKFVQVRFTSGGNLYTYFAPGAEVGDWAVVPPPSQGTAPKLVRVMKLGRGPDLARRDIRPAALVPRDIARGEDLWG